MPTNLNPNATPFNPHAPVFVSSSSSTNLDFPPLSRFNGGQPFSVGAPSADDSSQSAPAAPPDDVEAAALDNDVATLVSLGLRLADIERLWGKLPHFDAAAVRAAGERLMAQPKPEVPVGRQASLGLELLNSTSKAAGGAAASPSKDDVSTALAALRAEWDDPPERFRDPITLGLMSEPMVLSSGHAFDKATIYNADGEMRFERCPMTREAVSHRAYPLLYLRRELVEFKLKRLDAILSAAKRCEREPTLQLLAFAKELLDSLGASTYRDQTRMYWDLRFDRYEGKVVTQADEMTRAQTAACVRALVEPLAELGEALKADKMDFLEPMLEEELVTFEDYVANRHGLVGLDDATEALEIVTKLRVLLTRKSFVQICILLVEQLAERGAKPRSAIREILDLFRPPAEDKDKIDEGDLASANDYARMYWEQRLQLCDGDSEAELRVLLRLSRHSLQGKKMVGVSVSGAGVPACNGEYSRDGEYSGCPLFKNGQWWMLRYRMPSGSHMWYIADKDQLNVDSGDLYRIRTESTLPPCNGVRWRLARDGREPAPNLEAVYSSPVSQESPLRTLLAQHTERLKAKGVDVSVLDTPPRGAIASISGRKGWFVDQVVLTMRAEAGSSVMRRYGEEGGNEVEPFELSEGESIVKVTQYFTGEYLGSKIVLSTSEGRECSIEGEQHAEHAADGECTIFQAKADEHNEIVELEFEEGVLVAVKLRGDGGADDERRETVDAEDEEVYDEDDEEEGEEEEEEEGEESDEEGEGGGPLSQWGRNHGSDMMGARNEEEEELQIQMAIALSMADNNPNNDDGSGPDGMHGMSAVIQNLDSLPTETVQNLVNEANQAIEQINEPMSPDRVVNNEPSAGAAHRTENTQAMNRARAANAEGRWRSSLRLQRLRYVRGGGCGCG